MGLRLGVACGCVGTQCGAAKGRSVKLRMGEGVSEGCSVELRMAATWGRAGVQHAAEHGHKLGPRRGQR